MTLALQDETDPVLPEGLQGEPDQVPPPLPLPAVDGLAVVRAEGVAAVVVKLLKVAALDLVDIPSRAVLVTEPSPAAAGAHSHLVIGTSEGDVPVRGTQPSGSKYFQFPRSD